MVFLLPSCPHFLLASNTFPLAASHAGVVTDARLDFPVKNPTCENPANVSFTSSKAKMFLLYVFKSFK